VTREWEARGQRVGFIASVDGAHVGTQFGDPRVLTAERLHEIESGDRAFWRYCPSGDCEAMHAPHRADNNGHNIDAHPALYTLLTGFPELRASFCTIAQAHSPQHNIVVSFAADEPATKKGYQASCSGRSASQSSNVATRSGCL
jgi:hypothetical protein